MTESVKALTLFAFRARAATGDSSLVTVMRRDSAWMCLIFRRSARATWPPAPRRARLAPGIDRELAQALARGERNVGDRLEQEFEKTLIRRALAHTGGHRMEAAAWLGWGRNTLTRKIQELGMEPELRKGMRG